MNKKRPENAPTTGDDALTAWRERQRLRANGCDKLGGPSREGSMLFRIDYYGDGRGTRIPLAEEDNTVECDGRDEE